MTYKSPIEAITDEWNMELVKEFDDGVVKAVQHYGFNIDKNELAKALNYDRNSYEKGFKDGVEAAAWVQCSERLPEKEGRYIILDCDECVSDDIFVKNDYGDHDWIGHGNDVIAWIPFPEISEEIIKKIEMDNG